MESYYKIKPMKNIFTIAILILFTTQINAQEILFSASQDTLEGNSYDMSQTEVDLPYKHCVDAWAKFSKKNRGVLTPFNNRQFVY